MRISDWSSDVCSSDLSDKETSFDALDCRHGCSGAHIDVDSAETLHQPANQLRLEVHEHPWATLEDGHLGAGASGNVRELSRDIAAPDKHDPLRQCFQRQKSFVIDQVLFAVDAKLDRLRSEEHTSELPVTNAHIV